MTSAPSSCCMPVSVWPRSPAGLAPTHHTLLAARLAAGAFGGLAGSLVTAMVGDIIPPARRGRAMSYVMTAFPLASVLGVPAGLVLAGRFGLHVPSLSRGCATANVLLAAFALPHLATAVKGHQPLRQMRDILAHGVHRRAFAVGTVLAMSGGVIIPFGPFRQCRPRRDLELPLAYAVGGIATAFEHPFYWLAE